MAADPTTLSAILREIWTGTKIAENFYREVPLLDDVKKNTTPISLGKKAVTPVNLGGNTGLSWTDGTATDPFNAAGQQNVQQAEWTLKHAHIQINLAGSIIDQSDGNAEAVASALDVEVQGAINDLRYGVTREMFGDGTGFLAQCGTTTASTTVVLADDFAIRKGYLRVGTPIDIGTTSDEDTIGDARTVTAVNPATPSITISGAAVTTSASHFVSIAGSRSGSASKVINGLRNIVGTSTLGGLGPANHPDWQAASAVTASAALSLSIMDDLEAAVFEKTGKESTYVLTSVKQRKEYYQLLQSQVRFAGDVAGSGGVSNVQYNGKSVKAFPACPDGHMYFLTPKDLVLISQGEPKWQNSHTGGNILDWKQGFDGYVGAATYRLNLGAERRNSHAGHFNLS